MPKNLRTLALAAIAHIAALSAQAHPGHGVEALGQGAAHRLLSPGHELPAVLALAALGVSLALAARKPWLRAIGGALALGAALVAAV